MDLQLNWMFKLRAEIAANNCYLLNLSPNNLLTNMPPVNIFNIIPDVNLIIFFFFNLIIWGEKTKPYN